MTLRRSSAPADRAERILDRRMTPLEGELSRLTRPPRWRRYGSALFTMLVIAAVIFMWPDRLGGATNMVVVRGYSMEPVYHLNDVVVSRGSAPYQVGDIVVFAIPDGNAKGMLVIHRIIGKRANGSWVTQGDNRDTPDQWELKDSDLKGTPVFVIPRAGRLLQLANNTFVISGALGLLVIVVMWPRKKPPPPTLVAAYNEPVDEPMPESLRVSPAVETIVAALIAENDELDDIDDDVAAQADEWLAAELERLGVNV